MSRHLPGTLRAARATVPREVLVLLTFLAVCITLLAVGQAGLSDGTILSSAIIAACIATVGKRIGSFRAGNAHIWAMFTAVIIGTLSKLTLLSYVIKSPSKMYRDYPELTFVTRESIGQALTTAATGLVLLTLVMVVLPGFNRQPGIVTVSPPRIKVLIVSTLVLGLSAAALQLRLRIGILGSPASAIGLDTVITRTTGSVVPALSLLALSYAAASRRYELAAIAVHVGLAGGLSLITTSRGTIFTALLSMGMLYVILRRANFRLLVICITVGFAGLIMFSVATSLRQTVLTGSGGYSSIPLDDSALFAFTRIQGADGLLEIARYNNGRDLPPSSSPSGRYDQGIAKYYTRDVVGVTAENDFRSPGLLAGVFLLTGEYGFPLAVLLLGSTVHLYFGWLGGRGAVAVSSALGGTYVFSSLNEGTLNYRDLLFFSMTVLGVSMVHRIVSPRPRRSGRHGPAVEAQGGEREAPHGRASPNRLVGDTTGLTVRQTADP